VSVHRTHNWYIGLILSLFYLSFHYCSLSPGQKQLVVLARALLQKHKVLILDEATASIDSATDAEISRVVHEKFTGATILIIAQRLRVGFASVISARLQLLTIISCLLRPLCLAVRSWYLIKGFPYSKAHHMS